MATETQPLLTGAAVPYNANDRVEDAEQARSKPLESSAQDNGDVVVSAGEEIENPDRPKGLRFAVVFGCILMGDFLTGYDTSCVTTLTPPISEDFHAIDDVAWYGIAYVLAIVSTILTFGQLYSLYPNKAIYLGSYSLFAIGSAVSASAVSSTMFIIGRGLSGLGSAGVFSGGTIIIANTTPLATRPIFQGIAGGMESVALALGPVMSGALARGTSWRVPFWVIVPATAVIMVAVGALVPRLPQPKKASLPTEDRWRELDLLGTLLFVPLAVCLILALQWGGIELPWGNPKIIALLVMASVLAIAFAYVEWQRGNNAMFPLRLLKHRSVTLGSAAQFGVSAFLFVFAFYLPIYFQAIRGASTFDSGIMYLPTAASLAVSVFLAGPITSFIGYYTPLMGLGTVLMVLSAGLMTTFTTTTPAWQYSLYQIPAGLGAGMAFQQTYTAVQTLLPDADVATGLVSLTFMQEIGGIVALGVAQNLFLSLLATRLGRVVPGFHRRDLLENGVVSLPNSVPGKYRDAVLEVYNRSVVDVFYLGLACACLTGCAVGIEWRSIKEEKTEQSDEGEALGT